MAYRVRIDGIYDLRTLKHLKQNQLKDFCFDFSPRSFNFIPEHIFLEQLVPLLGHLDRVFVHFPLSNDLMVAKLANDLKKAGIDLGQVYFEFDEWSPEVSAKNFEFNYLLRYSKDLDVNKAIGKNFCGFVFEFSLLEDLYQKNLLNRFTANFHTRFHSLLKDPHFLVLKLQWNSNIMSSLFDFFEFDLISMPISSDIEVCYRNVDLSKLSAEMNLFKKNKFLGPEF